MPCFSLPLSSINLLAVQDLADREALDKVVLQMNRQHTHTHLSFLSQHSKVIYAM